MGGGGIPEGTLPDSFTKERTTTMEILVGLDVSVASTSVCALGTDVKVVNEAMVTRKLPAAERAIFCHSREWDLIVNVRMTQMCSRNPAWKRSCATLRRMARSSRSMGIMCRARRVPSRASECGARAVPERLQCARSQRCRLRLSAKVGNRSASDRMSRRHCHRTGKLARFLGDHAVPSIKCLSGRRPSAEPGGARGRRQARKRS